MPEQVEVKPVRTTKCLKPLFKDIILLVEK